LSTIRIELCGVPRRRAGVSEVRVESATVGEALGALGAAYPTLKGSILVGEAVHPAYRLNLNGERFVSEPGTALADGDCLILMAADAGDEAVFDYHGRYLRLDPRPGRTGLVPLGEPVLRAFVGGGGAGDVDPGARDGGGRRSARV
jgi:molybdopterin converting factor small subunit